MRNETYYALMENNGIADILRQREITSRLVFTKDKGLLMILRGSLLSLAEQHCGHCENALHMSRFLSLADIVLIYK